MLLGNDDNSGSVLLVTHGSPSSTIIRACADRSKNARVGYTGLTVLVPFKEETGFKWETALVADTNHLEGLKSFGGAAGR